MSGANRYHESVLDKSPARRNDNKKPLPRNLIQPDTVMKASMIRNASSDDFSKMLEESLEHNVTYSPGDRIRGKIESVSGDTALIGITGKSEAYLMAVELNEAGKPVHGRGDTLDLFVANASSGRIELTAKIGRGYISDALLRTASRESLPVWGSVKEEIKGGFSVMIGSYRAFCPVSQLAGKNEDTSALIGRGFEFLITEFRSASDIVVSRRALSTRKSAEARESMKGTVSTGSVMSACVSRIAEFGVFVDLGGVDALVPRSELSWSRLTTPDAFKSGEQVTVKIMSADWDANRISASIKEALPDPWKTLSVAEGESYTGTVTNIIKSGAFVELAPGIEGFIHVSRMSPVKRINKPEDAVSIGAKVTVHLDSIDHKEKRISLTLMTGEDDPWKNPDAQIEVAECTVESTNNGGVVIRLTNGMEGFIPRAQLSRKGEHTREYKPGESLRVAVTEIDRDRKRVLASEKELELAEERKSLDGFLSKSTDAVSSTSSLGALLGDKLKGFKN